MTSTDIVRRTPQQELAQRIRQDDFTQQIAAALPPSVTAERFLRVATTAILTNDDIAKCDPNSVMRALIRCATDGLMPDGKEAAIVKRGRENPQANYMPMIKGYRKKLAEHGWTLRTAVVYENDEFQHFVEDGEEKIQHAPVRPGADRGDLIAAYGIAKHRDGRRLLSVLHPDDIAKRRESSAYDAVWNQHPAAMWEKSAGRDVYEQVGLAEIDAKRDVIATLIESDPDEAAALIYGPPQTSGFPVTTEVMTTSAEPAEQPEPSQQAVPPPASQTPAPGETAPGDHDDEPIIGDSPAVGADTEQLVELARAASLFVIPNGRNKDKTLGELYDAGEDGQKWLVWALGKITDPQPYRAAIRDFCRVYLPDAYAAAAAEQGAS